MSEHTPITGELRENVCTESYAGHQPSVVRMEQEKFDRLCDAIDAIHAGLERENAELRERLAKMDNRGDSMHIAESTIIVTPRIDWMRMVDELDVFTQLVRGFAEQVGEDE